MAFAIIYVFLDLLYYVLTTAVYKYILINYFDSVEDGFVYKEGKDASSITRTWVNVEFWWMVIMSLFLLISSLLMIIYVFTDRISEIEVLPKIVFDNNIFVQF